MDLSPVRLAPSIKDYIWGGHRLIDEFNKQTDLERAAESWELSTHPDGESIVSSGSFKGKKLSEYINSNGRECIGSYAASFDFFPILIKLIDAKASLSIQVHPDDEYALKAEKEYGKTEMWYIVDCEPGAYLYYGLNRTVTRAEFKQRIESNTILDILNKVPVHKGDVFFIPSGTLHAICAGILICEIQQNSNTTYRVYDYNRRGADGKPRELHIDKALETTNITSAPPRQPQNGNVLASCKYFTAEKLICKGSANIALDKECFRSLIVLEGHGQLELNDTILSLNKGDSIFIPAQNGKAVVSGSLTGIVSYCCASY